MVMVVDKNRFVFVLGLTVLLCLNSTIAGIVIMGRLTHERTVQPGDKINGEIVIHNSGEKLEEIKIYQTDYLFSHDGTSQYGEPGFLSRSNAGWITFAPKRLTVPPRENVTVNFEVHVPESDTLIGTYWSILMVEGIPRSSLESTMPDRTVGISSILRYGIQVVNHIGETGIRDMRFIGAEIVQDDTSRIFQVDMENTGERWLRPKVWAEIYRKDGAYMGKYEGNQFRIFPGTSVRHRINLSGLTEGTYKAMVVADGGNDDLFGIPYTLNIE
jgi:hypothetical protein